MLNTPPETVCLQWRDYYDEYLKNYKDNTAIPLQKRIKSSSDQVLGLNQTYMDGLLETYGLSALDNCYIEGDLYGRCSEADIEMSYTTAYYFR